jgi:type I restriction enzyme S subunit
MNATISLIENQSIIQEKGKNNEREILKVPLGDLCFTTSGGTPSRKISSYYIGDIPWVKSGELGDNLIVKTDEYISEEAIKNSSAKLFPKGTLLIALYGANIGKLAFLGIDATTNQAICGIFENKYVNLKYIYYYLRFQRSKLIEQGIGGGQPNISQDIVRKQEIPVFSLAEQHRIVAKIEELFSSLDNGIQNLKTAQQQLKIYRQAVLKWAFEGKLTSAKNDISQTQGINDLPEGWQWVKLSEICKLAGGAAKGRNFKGKETVQIPYLRVANVQDGYLNLDEIKTIEALASDKEKYRLQYGDILYTEGGDKDKLGRGTIWKNEIKDCIHQNHVFRARPISEQIDSKFIAYFSQTRLAKNYFFKRAKQTTNLASINLTVLSNLPLPLPPKLHEQQAIVAEIESRLSVCDKLEETIQTSLKQAEILRQSILKKAFSGQLVPQNPNDEPASLLLEKIQGDRAKNNPKTRSPKAKKQLI